MMTGGEEDWGCEIMGQTTLEERVGRNDMRVDSKRLIFVESKG
jgi:hypothetical protein